MAQHVNTPENNVYRKIIFLTILVSFNAWSLNQEDSQIAKIIYEKILSEENCLRSQSNYLGCYLTRFVYDRSGETSKQELLTAREAAKVFFKTHKAAEALAWQGFKDSLEPSVRSTSQFMLKVLNLYLSFSMDPHSHMMLLDQGTKAQKDNIESGVGIYIARKNEQIFVYKVIPDSPVFLGGVKKGDQLLAIDQKSVEASDYYEIPKLLANGPVGSNIELTVRRGQNIQAIKLQRAKVIEKSFSYQIKNLSHQKQTAILRIESFDNINAFYELKTLLYSLEKQENITGYILDLRDNGGGEMDIAKSIAGLFMEDTPDENGFTQAKTVYLSRPLQADLFFPQRTSVGQKTKRPLVILMNSNTASAAEMLAGSLRDQGRAILVGERSFGKATAQLGETVRSSTQGFESLTPEELKLMSENYIFFRTLQMFYSPLSGTTHQLVDLKPDFQTNPEEQVLDVPALREEDLFINPIAPEPNRLFSPKVSLSNTIKTVESCLDHNGNSNPSDAESILALGLEVLDCYTKN